MFVTQKFPGILRKGREGEGAGGQEPVFLLTPIEMEGDCLKEDNDLGWEDGSVYEVLAGCAQAPRTTYNGQ